MNNIRRLITIGALTIGTVGITAYPAFASPYTSYAPGGAGRTTYNTSNNHYQIYDTKGDHRAVAVIFFRLNGEPVGFQSCHEGAGDDCPGDLPGSVGGTLCMQTGVGLGSSPTGYKFGPAVCFDNA